VIGEIGELEAGKSGLTDRRSGVGQFKRAFDNVWAVQMFLQPRCGHELAGYLDYSSILDAAVDVLTNDNDLRKRLAQRVKYRRPPFIRRHVRVVAPLSRLPNPGNEYRELALEKDVSISRLWFTVGKSERSIHAEI
jgi:hypothetical protein